MKAFVKVSLFIRILVIQKLVNQSFLGEGTPPNQVTHLILEFF